MTELFTNSSPSVRSDRILYTPSQFAKSSLLHLQEVGSLQALHPHISTREHLPSFLCFVVRSGCGELYYEEKQYRLSAGDCVFLDCRRPYRHATGCTVFPPKEGGAETAEQQKTEIPSPPLHGPGDENLWSLQWCHFYSPTLPSIY